MGQIYRQHAKEAKRLQKKLGIILLILLPAITLGWLVDYYLGWHYILAIITTSFYGFFVGFYWILRAVNKG